MGTAVTYMILTMNFKPLLILVLVALLVQPNEGQRRRSNNSCTRHNQCYSGRCVRHNDYLCGLGSFIGNIFGGGRRTKQKICHSYKCAQCTSNRHCSGNQVCSGYSCVSPQTYTEKPFYWTTTTQAPYYDYNKDYNNFDSFTTPKPFDTSKYFDESSIYN